ncbi:hypothetical protein [Flagellimonas sediminis]|uniref:Uncharacterized protein n=1 Tax=Flagellimonas sediminis TaxID=2696468 RepID=A0A6I5KSK0_9FLAO|nr:hypothetical protein [Allomuricauda sediminis]NDV42639.1 hypothetical protein [Allomuricauda sediminis]
MNKLEKLVYDAVKHNPKVKIKIRNMYQSFYDALPNKKDYSVNPIQAKEGHFFGFHDVSPFSFDDTKVLANKLTIPLRMPEKKDVLEVGYFEIENGQVGDYVKVGESRAWNYHKGCRLQWAGPDHIIYNDADGEQLVSRLYNIHDKTTKKIPYPIDTASLCGKFATSFSYGRLEMTMPGYGYSYDDGALKDVKIPKETGLFIGNLEDGTRELVADLQTLNDQGGLTQYPIENAHQYVTHSLFSPDGRYVSFLYRATVVEDILKRWTQMGVYDRETKQLHFSPTNEMVSHYVWNDKNQIIAYSRVEEQDSHVLFEEPTLQKYKRVAYPQLNSDGHQSFISSSSFVTDTYPDKYRMAKLYKVDIESDKATLLASVNSLKKFQSKAYRHWCCDLHPRMNRKGDMVCFDSVHTGKRALCVMPI